MFPFNNAVNSLFGFKSEFDELFGDNSFSGNFVKNDIICPKCKTRLSDVEETMFVGCTNCYKLFKDLIDRSAYRYHGRLGHIGKVPSRAVTKAEKIREIEVLENQKSQAVAKEDYTLADTLKKKIEQLRSEL